MPFDGNGIYNPIGPPYFPAVSGTTITSNQYNLQIQDMATALSNCMTRDGQGKPTATIDFNSQKISNLAPAVSNADAVRLDQVATTAKADVAVNGTLVNNNVAYKGKNAAGTTNYALLWVGADNNIYFGLNATQTGSDWFMMYDRANDRVVFNKAVRVQGILTSTQNIGANQP